MPLARNTLLDAGQCADTLAIVCQAMRYIYKQSSSITDCCHWKRHVRSHYLADVIHVQRPAPPSVVSETTAPKVLSIGYKSRHIKLDMHVEITKPLQAVTTGKTSKNPYAFSILKKHIMQGAEYVSRNGKMHIRRSRKALYREVSHLRVFG